MSRLLLTGVLLVALAAPAAASDHTPEDVAAEVSGSVMSPFCPGVTLHDCPSAEADKWRRRIAAWARSGMSKRQIIDRLETQFDPSIRAVPPAGGSGLAAWLLPAVVVVAGIATAVVLARRWSARPAAQDPPPPSPEDRQRLEVELAKFREQAP